MNNKIKNNNNKNANSWTSTHTKKKIMDLCKKQKKKTPAKKNKSLSAWISRNKCKK